MISILVYAGTIPNLEQMLSYSNMFELKIYTCQNQKQALSTFIHCQPQFFVVQCDDADAENLRFIQGLSQEIPTLVLTEQGNESAAIKALQNGADYLVHYPVNSVEFFYQLLNFIHLTSKQQLPENNLLHLGELTIFLNSNQVMLNDEFIPLTATEHKLLRVLAGNINQIVSTDKLYSELYSTSELKYTSRALNMHISNLRHKLHIEEYACLRLETIRGKGYALFYNDDTKGDEYGG